VFGDWQKHDLPAQTFVGPPDPTRRVIVINKPDAVQTEVRVGHIGIPRTHPDYMAVNLAIRILGGEGSNRLHQVLRTERGLTYGAQANMDTLKDSGDFEAETNTRSDATGEVLRLIVDEFWRLQRERVGDRELDGAKAYLTGSFPLTIETPESIAMQVVNALFYGLPLAELQNFRERVNAVTPDDIQRVAKALLRPDRLSVVLVGNSAAFASQLRAVGFGTFETIDLDDLDLTSATFKRTTGKAQAGGAGAVSKAGRPGGAGGAGRSGRVAYQQAPLASRPSDAAPPEETAKAIALLDKVIAAKGGLENLRGLKSIVARQTQISQRPDGESTVETTNYIEYPNHVRVETQGQVQAFDGTRVWMKDTRGIHDAPEMFVREMTAGLRRDVVALLLAAKAGTVAVRLLPDVKEADGQVSHVLELSATDLNPIVLYVLPETSQIRKRVYAADAPGRPIVEETFFDYRDVGGIQFAYRATQKVGPLSVERRVTDVKLNAPVDPALFKRPAS
jgi:outer membrane lipoprotein-sorting protein